MVVIANLAGVTTDNIPVEVELSPPRNIRFLNVKTLELNGWVAWKKINIVCAVN